MDAGALAGFLYGSPGAAALVIARPRPGGPLPGGGRAARGDDQAHVYWLVADGRGGPVVLRWADAGTPFGQPARPGDWQGGYLRDPDTRVVVFDPAGRPSPPAPGTAGGRLSSRTPARPRPCWTRPKAGAVPARCRADPRPRPAPLATWEPGLRGSRGAPGNVRRASSGPARRTGRLGLRTQQ